jgi:hypothetical protein
LYQMVLFDEERKNIFEIDLVFEFGLISFYWGRLLGFLRY